MTIQRSDQIAQVIRNAVVFNVKNWLGDTMNTDSLSGSIVQLFAILEERRIKYVLVGGIALLHYVEGRNTEDIDLIMALSSLKRIPEIVIESQDPFFVRGKFGELKIDILLTKNPLFKKVQKNFVERQHILDLEIPIASVEGLLLLKLYALPSLYRQGNFGRVGLYENDIATLIHAYRPDLALVMKELASFVSDPDLVEIEGILADIQKRIERFQKL